MTIHDLFSARTRATPLGKNLSQIITVGELEIYNKAVEQVVEPFNFITNSLNKHLHANSSDNSKKPQSLSL